MQIVVDRSEAGISCSVFDQVLTCFLLITEVSLVSYLLLATGHLSVSFVNASEHVLTLVKRISYSEHDLTLVKRILYYLLILTYQV